MALISGFYPKTLYRDIELPTACPNCKTTFSLAAEVTCKVNHIYYIPFIASTKRVLVTCAICKSCYLPDGYSIDEINLKKKAHYKWYHFSGLFCLCIILGFLAYGFYETKKVTDKQDAIYQIYLLNKLKSLQQNDIIFYKLKNGEFSTFKITQKSKDTIFGFENTTSTNRAGNVELIDRPKNYTNISSYYTITQLKTMIEENTIKSIEK